MYEGDINQLLQHSEPSVIFREGNTWQVQSTAHNRGASKIHFE